MNRKETGVRGQELTPAQQYDRAIEVEMTGIDPLTGRAPRRPRRRRDGSDKLLAELTKQDRDFWRGL
jgi:hypothetical protein